MRQLITREDIEKIIGRWIVQLDSKNGDIDLTHSDNDGFWLEKRISFIGNLYGSDGHPHVEFKNKASLIIANGICYSHGVFTPEEFVEYFNNGHNGKSERYHRLLTNKELDWLNEHLKKQNY